VVFLCSQCQNVVSRTSYEMVSLVRIEFVRKLKECYGAFVSCCCEKLVIETGDSLGK
jgi:hypothetical protein